MQPCDLTQVIKGWGSVGCPKFEWQWDEISSRLNKMGQKKKKRGGLYPSRACINRAASVWKFRLQLVKGEANLFSTLEVFYYSYARLFENDLILKFWVGYGANLLGGAWMVHKHDGKVGALAYSGCWFGTHSCWILIHYSLLVKVVWICWFFSFRYEYVDFSFSFCVDECNWSWTGLNSCCDFRWRPQQIYACFMTSTESRNLKVVCMSIYNPSFVCWLTRVSLLFLGWNFHVWNGKWKHFWTFNWRKRKTDYGLGDRYFSKFWSKILGCHEMV